ncbi:MAG: 4Fe-4S binding protein [Firmicutes bacterium]|nr:4Fe-4S binding protein [Bacillota bacterium]
MKELLVISGKGGTGKTTVVGAFAVLAKDTPLTENTVLVDCDVDAADLHLILNPGIREKKEFFGLKKATLDPAKCNNCGACVDVCRFGAIASHDGIVKIEPISCEGCGVCYRVCPNQAIRMEDVIAGHWFASDTPYGPMVHARLGIAEENSGKLVMEVRREARSIAETRGSHLIICDGPPGIGCPVISSMSGVDLALIVTEPTVAGIHDMERLHSLADGFNVEVVVCINKYDLDHETSAQIEEYCLKHDINVVGKIPFDEEVVKALVKGEPLVSPGVMGGESESLAAKAVEQLWAEVLERLS